MLTIPLAVTAVTAGLLLLWASGMVRYVPNTRVGVVEELWSGRGSVEQRLIALRGQAGFQAFGGPRYQLTQQVIARFAEAVERGHVDILPKVMVGGGAPDGKEGLLGGNSLGALMGMMLASKADTELREGGLMR
jgi:hypothetical protein